MQKKKTKFPKDWIKGFTYKFSTSFNRAEMLEIEELSKQIYESVEEKSFFPDGLDNVDGKNYPFYIRNGVKISSEGGKYRVLHTFCEPYMRVADRWFLRMILTYVSSDESSST